MTKKEKKERGISFNSFKKFIFHLNIVFFENPLFHIKNPSLLYTIYTIYYIPCLKYIHFSFTRSNFCYTLYKEIYVYRGINIAHFQLLLQQTFHVISVPSIQHSILPIPSVQIVQSRTFYPHKCLSGKNTWWRDDRDKHSMWRACTVTSRQRAWNSMITNHVRPRSSNGNPILTLESGAVKRVGVRQPNTLWTK